MLELLASEYRGLMQDVLTVVVCTAALIYGRGPERAIAVTWLLVFELSGRVYFSFIEDDFRFGELGLFDASVDLVALVVMVAIALNANRNYTLWIAAMQVLAFSAHLARSLTDIISPIAYAVLALVPGWMQLLLLAAGLIRHILRERRFGPYREWRVPVRFWGLLPATRDRS